MAKKKGPVFELKKVPVIQKKLLAALKDRGLIAWIVDIGDKSKKKGVCCVPGISILIQG